MAIGPFVRNLLGPLEIPISNAYRAAFFDIEAFIDQVRTWVPTPERILDVGCGEGLLLKDLADAYPQARLSGIDISGREGRLFRGGPERAQFAQIAVQDFAPQHECEFDLALLVDVLHHAPRELHRDLLQSILRCLKPGGHLVIKDWEATRTPPHAAAWFSDRVLTGDSVRFFKRPELRAVLQALGDDILLAEATIGPWRNNMTFLLRRPAQMALPDLGA